MFRETDQRKSRLGGEQGRFSLSNPSSPSYDHAVRKVHWLAIRNVAILDGLAGLHFALWIQKNQVYMPRNNQRCIDQGTQYRANFFHVGGPVGHSWLKNGS